MIREDDFDVSKVHVRIFFVISPLVVMELDCGIDHFKKSYLNDKKIQ